MKEAAEKFTEALAIRRQLYPPARFPDGHPDLAISLDNLGTVLDTLGQPAKALDYYERALAMGRKLYPAQRFPDGHTELAISLNNLGYVLHALDQPAKALDYFEQALAMYRKLGRRETGKAPEGQALAYRRALGQLPLQRGYLSAATQVPPSVALYTPLWHARGELLLLLQTRHQPEFKRLQEMDQKGPADLARALPLHAAFIDFIRYRHWDKNKPIGQRYVAFVVVPNKEPTFLQLGDAVPIDTAIVAWRQHIATGQNSLAPAKLRDLVWDKVARALPAQTKVVYLCLDGDLARLPFAALPGSRPDTVMLEDYALAVVPSGPWLLDQLLHPPPPRTTPGQVLVVGEVDYGRPGGPQAYPALASTGLELKRVLEAFGQGPSDGLAGSAASTAAVRQRLTTVRYAHFATHGYFDEKSLSAERKRLQNYLDEWTFQADNPLARPSLRNPAGYVGLVLAGSNDPKNAGPDGGILTGLSVVDLPLEGLRLCVLSACETGLGELTEGEGVLGLQRAFHAAGCPDVVGSLWKVSDAATAALMAQFYHELRAKGRPPLEALREAQLTVYRHPERIADLAGERGRPALEAAEKLGSASGPNEPDKAPKRAATKQWAAFVLSGAGTAN